ncbi:MULTISPECIES: Txe/YoeB family addiction module toxin [unclassified Marinobacter]|uniref:Txe/YoeB family addiction module toxin n=1 Tax=unclassified Marinobacter TaxID=83889 RepID=UPI00200D35E0|nr:MULTISPECIES: Txe/YoeB family addiction module toxin [unclassified Marinobacter]UQG55923.1 Txe/YoeB family addiction module toxin [Marinobacter sp. M4C]UQG64728.1 Txe/YoeB family addiction module toxin [Marinobacter sp. M2C]UQG69006.1 Txe/YoeB family addiction module toxin [Marinobacter sp. M1C]
MKLIFSENAWEDYLYWQKTDKKALNRINKLIKETKREPFEGVGKPEPLKHNLAGYWSRRINEEHRIVYKVTDDALLMAQLRYHY